MIVAIVGIILGLIVGMYIPISMTAQYSLYVAVAILAAIDSLFGGIRAHIENSFDGLIFVSGFVTNAILAAGLAFVGDKIGVPLYYAAVFAFGVRFFQNMAIIRRKVVDKIRNK